MEAVEQQLHALSERYEAYGQSVFQVTAGKKRGFSLFRGWFSSNNPNFAGAEHQQFMDDVSQILTCILEQLEMPSSAVGSVGAIMLRHHNCRADVVEKCYMNAVEGYLIPLLPYADHKDLTVIRHLVFRGNTRYSLLPCQKELIKEIDRLLK